MFLLRNETGVVGVLSQREGFGIFQGYCYFRDFMYYRVWVRGRGDVGLNWFWFCLFGLGCFCRDCGQVYAVRGFLGFQSIFSKVLAIMVVVCIVFLLEEGRFTSGRCSRQQFGQVRGCYVIFFLGFVFNFEFFCVEGRESFI